MKIKKGDTVVVIAGKDKGAKGKVIAGLPASEDKVLVEGVNRVKKHTKVRTTQRGGEDRRHRHPGGPDPRLERDGGRLEGKPTRVGYRATTRRPARRSASRVSAPVRTSDD
jgi:large subunit ribosomal protein L24